MTPLQPSLFEPLQCFDGLESALKATFTELDSLVVRYRARRDAGGVLPTVRKSLRIELTYNSNAIEGSTLTLRETQLVIEGRIASQFLDFAICFSFATNAACCRLAIPLRITDSTFARSRETSAAESSQRPGKTLL